LTSGDIAIKGRSMNDVRSAKRNIAMVLPYYAFYPDMDPRLEHGVRSRDCDGADRNSSAVNMIEAPVEVSEFAGAGTFMVRSIGGKGVAGRFCADVAIRRGDRFNFVFNMEKAVTFNPGPQARSA
jgi:hypothetical protein